MKGAPQLAQTQDGKNDYTESVTTLEGYTAVVTDKVYKK